MFDKTIILWLEFLLEPMTNHPVNYQLLQDPSTDLECVWSKFKFLLKLKKKNPQGIGVQWWGWNFLTQNGMSSLPSGLDSFRALVS